MAGGDRTGPEGRGPRTGRGFGYCAGNDRPGYQTNAPQAGRGSALAAEVARRREQVQALVDRLSRSGD